ncbi:MAG TPA: VOC family protein [bacterium]|nr:VOC family protein [bacterium]HNB09537.1 VOC family protein [bacterium]HNE83300.1 VOC family protein [bacterium]
MKRVTGLGGVFFRCEDPGSTMAWYQKHLGVQPDGYGGSFFEWLEKDNTEEIGITAFSTMSKKTKYFHPSRAQFMINFRVKNLKKLMEVLRAEGVQQIGKIETFEYGSFGWILDPNGVKIELWEPVKGYRFKRKRTKK